MAVLYTPEYLYILNLNETTTTANRQYQMFLFLVSKKGPCEQLARMA